MTRQQQALSLLIIAAGIAKPLGAMASELAYTYVDFRAVAIDSAYSGSQVPVQSQTVRVQTDDGDGIGIGGGVAIGQRFFVGGRFQTAIVDIAAVIENPLGVTAVEDNFDVVESRLAFGYYKEIGDNFDFTVELSVDSMEFDFGSFAGENFDMRDEGVGGRVGFRWNPRTPLEVSGYANYSAVGDADFAARVFEPATNVGVGVMWYFFEDLGIGLDYESGEIDSVAFSMRFSFGDLTMQR